MAVSSSFLKVFAQAELEERIIPIVEAQTIVGRAQECGTALIPSKGLSRHHVEILVDGSEHFIKDLGSRNKTYRFTHQLRPHVYYELRNNTELHLANVKCLYVMTDPSTKETAPSTTEAPSKQYYSDQISAPGDSDQSTVNGDQDDHLAEGDDIICRNDIEPTQPYFSEGHGEEHAKGIIECESTIPYNEEDFGLCNNNDDNSSVHSSPILGGRPLSINEDIKPIAQRHTIHKVSFDPAVCSTEEEEEEEEEEEKDIVVSGPSHHAPFMDIGSARLAEPNNRTMPSNRTAESSTVSGESALFDGQTISMETTSFDGQTIPVEKTSFADQTSPVQTTSFDGQTIPVENTSFADQTSPVQTTSFDGQTIPLENTSFADSRASTISDEKCVIDSVVDRHCVPGTVKLCLEQSTKPLSTEEMPVYKPHNNLVAVEPTVVYNLSLDVDLTEDYSEDRKDVSNVLFSEQENDAATQCTSPDVSVLRKSLCQDEDLFLGENVKIRSSIAPQANSENNSMLVVVPYSSQFSSALLKASDRTRTEMDDFCGDLSRKNAVLEGISKMAESCLVADDGNGSSVEPNVGQEKAPAKTAAFLEADESKQPADVAQSALVGIERERGRSSILFDEGKSEEQTKVLEHFTAVSSKKAIVETVSELSTEVLDGKNESGVMLHPLDEDTYRNSLTSIQSTVASKSPPNSSSSSPSSQSAGRSTRSNSSAKRSVRAKATPRKSSKPSFNLESISASLRPKCSPEADKPRVLFTGIVYQAGEQIVKNLGGQLVDSVFECTHLVTDKMVRTVKLLCCLSRGCHIVSSRWLDQCQLQGAFLPADGFLLKDRAAERQHNFSLQRSLLQARQGKLLEGYKVFVTPSVTPDRAALSDIITCLGGQLLEVVPTTKDSRTLIVSCEQDFDMCKTALDAGLVLHTPELVLSGALRQELDLKLNILSDSVAQPKAHAKRKAEVSEEVALKRRRK